MQLFTTDQAADLSVTLPCDIDLPRIEGRHVILELTSVKVQTHVSFAGWVFLAS